MSQRDMFAKIEGTKQGVIKGESVDPQHPDEIHVLSWAWGMDASQEALGTRSGRTSMQELEITKRVDSATTPLMAALRNNELIKKLTLTVRKSGGVDALDYFSITLEKARITHQRIEGGNEADSTVLSEVIRVGFQKIAVQYQPQTKSGGSRGAMIFETDVQPD
ncbi:type VI secretion system receptor/chaperone Hcp [Niveibacterium umoris]|uniref:Type VI secretion system secreted protein Hcp n=1 Tax=Niveibacterium umoris TaxID=1193620 RepID=A0A840BL82_9RHOO|nr:type VI secretion system tube protein Hcp [Niveibacterium umoris]MBB4011646.1 type VI secretion system secreted protein Hcp [Niveibacterium umoris]